MSSCDNKQTFRYRTFAYGIGIGLANTAIFNPVDRALYLSMINKTSLFTKQNWAHPYSGIKEATIGRIWSYGMYFPIIDFYKCKLDSVKNDHIRLLFASSLTGSTLAIITNPITVTKIQNWNNAHTTGNQTGLFKLGKQLYSNYGLNKFARGLHYTIIRENVFSITYMMLNDRYNKEKSLNTKILFGFVSTALAAPINYCRNIVFSGSLSDPSIEFSSIVKNLIIDLKNHPNKMSHICFDKFMIGWGTLRVAFGMAFSEFVYEYFKDQT